MSFNNEAKIEISKYVNANNLKKKETLQEVIFVPLIIHIMALYRYVL
jgi:hypothetical protein